MVVHNTVPGTAALLRTMLTKQSRGLLKQSLVVLLSFFLFKVTKQQVTRLPPYSYSWTIYSLWEGCRSSKHVDQTKVPGTVTRVYENATYSLFNEYKSVYNSVYNCSRMVSDELSRDCNLIHIVVHNTVPGTDAFLGNVLTKQSRGPLPKFTRMLHTVPKTVILFIWWRTTHSLGLLPFFKPYWTNSPGDRYQGLREFHIQSPRLLHYSYGGNTQSLRWLLSFKLSGPNNIPQDCSHIHTVVHYTVPATAAVVWIIVPKQQSPSLVNMFRRRVSVPGTVLCNILCIMLQSCDNTSLTTPEQL